MGGDIQQSSCFDRLSMRRHVMTSNETLSSLVLSLSKDEDRAVLPASREITLRGRRLCTA